MKSLLIAILFCSAVAVAEDLPQRVAPILSPLPPHPTITGVGKHDTRFLFIRTGRATFTMPMDPYDTFGSVLKCFAKVHRRGGGTCYVSPHTLAPGRTRHLDNHKTPDTHLWVRSIEK